MCAVKYDDGDTEVMSVADVRRLALASGLEPMTSAPSMTRSQIRTRLNLAPAAAAALPASKPVKLAFSRRNTPPRAWKSTDLVIKVPCKKACPDETAPSEVKVPCKKACPDEAAPSEGCGVGAGWTQMYSLRSRAHSFEILC